MYEQFFGFECRPFTLRPDPRFLYRGETHTTALRMLEYGLFEQDGFVVLTGEVGSGKTMLVRHLLNTLDDNFQIGLIANTHASFGDLLTWVASAFGIEHDGHSESSTYDRFVEYLIHGYSQGRRTLLIVDEAQNLSVQSLEEVRVLSNINADGNQIIHLLLVGQPELRELLVKPALKQFAQRISMHHHVTPLDASDVGDYVNHRLVVAGARRPIFTDRALQSLALASAGVPRLINQIADMSLFYAFAEQARLVSGDIVRQVVWDRGQSRVLPLAHRPPDMPNAQADIS